MLVREDERYQGVEKHSSGFKLLASMGWKEGEGLVSCTPWGTSGWLRPIWCAIGPVLSSALTAGCQETGTKAPHQGQEGAGQCRHWSGASLLLHMNSEDSHHQIALNVNHLLSLLSRWAHYQQNALQAEAARKAKDWTVGMAAYDQVLAKLKNVGSPPALDSAEPDGTKTKKRKQPTASALPQAKGKKKQKGIEEASVPMSEETAGKAAEKAALAGESSHAEAVAKAENAIAARASHTARFGRRRAGKNVRRYAALSCSTMRTLNLHFHLDIP